MLCAACLLFVIELKNTDVFGLSTWLEQSYGNAKLRACLL